MKKKRVLVVDDSEDDLQHMLMILQDEQFEADTAKDGSEALDRLSEKDFDLIIIDILLPVVSGYELLRLMREKINHHAKMIYVSIVPEREVYKDDVDGFIQKPFSPETFMKEINRVLRRKK